MPVSKNGKLYYTEEQYQTARYDSSALEYARAQGYDLVQKGRYHTLREHSSMVFTESGLWFWNSRGLKGGAMEFAMGYEHKSRVEAVLALSGERVHTQDAAPRYQPKPSAQSVTEKQPFVLPPKNDSHKRMYAYLTKTRGIDPELVSGLMRQGKLFESAERHNAVFVFENNAGDKSGAFMRGTSTDPKYRFVGMAPGSDKAGSYFVFGGKTGGSVACVFEGCIDAMSYATLQKQGGNADWAQRFYIATSGAGDGNVMAFLKSHPQVSSVILCHDNDPAGNKMAQDLADKLRAMDYSVSRAMPKAKDFNEDLQRERQTAENDRKDTPDAVAAEETEVQEEEEPAQDAGHEDDPHFYEAMAREHELQRMQLLDFDDLAETEPWL